MILEDKQTKEKKKMKNNIIWAILFILSFMFGSLVFLCDARALMMPLRFQWDTNNTGQWEEVKIFARVEGEEYNYDSPLLVVPQEYIDGNSVPIDASAQFNYPDNSKTTVYFVAKSYKGDSFSEDSNEVSKTVDLVPLEPFNFTAVYNEEDNSIDFEWSITDVRASRYRIYKSSTIDGQYEPIIRIDYEEGKTNYSQKVPIDDLITGEEKTIFFKMASWAGDSPAVISSPYTEVIPISIDQAEEVIDKVLNFKLLLTD